MYNLSFEIKSNEEIWSLIDKNVDHILIHKFTPNNKIEWWPTDIKLPNGDFFDQINVRNMVFDIRTDLNKLKQIIELNTNQLRIYQFEKPIADTLVLEHLPEHNREKILLQNGLKHFFFCDYEFITIETSDVNFLKQIETNDTFKERLNQKNNS